MDRKVFYHVVTERPMFLGQKIIFDENHHSGVFMRINKEKLLYLIFCVSYMI